MHFTKCNATIPILFVIILIIISKRTVSCLEKAEHTDHQSEVNVDKVQYFCGSRLVNMLSQYCDKFNSIRRRKREIATVCCKGLGCSIRYAIANYCEEVKPEYKHLFTKPPKDDQEPQTRSTNQPPSVSHSKLINAIRKTIETDPSIIASNKSNKSKSNKLERERDRETKSAPRTRSNKQVRKTRKSRKLDLHESFAPERHHHSPSLSPNATISSISTYPTNNLTISNHPNVFRRSFRHRNQSGQHCKCLCRRSRPEQQNDQQPSLSRSFIGTDHVPRGNPVHSTAKLDFFRF